MEEENKPKIPADEYNAKVQEHKDANIDAETQSRLNAPMKKEEGLDEDEKQYLEKVVGMIESGEIDLAVPSSLLNEGVYNELAPEAQSKVEMNTRTMVHNLRMIKELYDHTDYETESHQMETMLEQLKQMVGRIESVNGDVLKI